MREEERPRERLEHTGGASLEEMHLVKRIGKVKTIEIKSALEIGKRRANFTEKARPHIRTA